jgi:glycosyltransferase involved in cell wall biosynthesis
MKVLQLCLKPSQPAKDGGCIAINNVAKGLLQLGVDLKVITLSTHKHPFDPANFDPQFVRQSKIEAVYIDTKVNIVDAFSNLVTSDSYNVSRFFSSDFDILLRKTLEANSFDVVHLESVFMTTYCHTIRRYSKAKIVLRSHNLEHMIWERLAEQTGNTAKKVYLKLLAKQLKKYELNVLQAIDGVAAITKDDADKYVNLGCKKPITVIPFGINLSDYYYKESVLKDTISLFHLGALDWKPNIEGVAWFLNDIWGPLTNKHSELTMKVAGRHIPEWLFNEGHANLENVGEVECAIDFIREQDIMIVPLLSAGGMRVKIIEGMALGKVVMSTTVGAEGIDVVNRKNILLADTPEQFEEQINWLLEDKNRIIEIGKEARRLIESKYDNEMIMRNLYGFYAELF